MFRFGNFGRKLIPVSIVVITAITYEAICEKKAQIGKIRGFAQFFLANFRSDGRRGPFWAFRDSTRMYLTGFEDRIQKNHLMFEIVNFFGTDVDLEREMFFLHSVFKSG